MKNGYARFEFQLQKLEELFINAAKQKNAALWLYNNDARTPIFMLEGLAKLYSGLHNKKMFTRLKVHLKLLEDTLGQIDYYDCFAKEFAKNKKIPAAITGYMQAQAREKVQSLNEILVEKKWIGENADRIKKIRKKLDEADWMKEKEETIAIAGYYTKAFTEINDFVIQTKGKFTEIETQVHSLRRKLRWLSIYPHALLGLIQLTDSGNKDEALKKYLVPDIINSPFNKMPDAGNNHFFLLLEKNYFLALSWMIDALGKLKDNGLRILAIAEALQQIKKTPQADALKNTYTILGNKSPLLKDILSEASAICKDYFKDKKMEKILYGISSVKK